MTVQQVLDQWKQFFRIGREHGEPRYSLYHESFRDFLKRKDVVRSARMSLDDAEEMIADRIEKDLLGP